MRWIQSLGQTASSLWQGGRGPMLVTIAGGWFLSIGVRMIYPTMLPHLRDAFGLSLTMGGLLLTVLSLAYAFGQLPGGVISDRVGEGRVLVISTAISSLTIALLVVAESRLVLYGATLLFGIGTGLYGVARLTAISGIYPDQVGVATGLMLGAGDGGQSLLPPVAGFLAVAATWQTGFGFTVPLFLLSAGSLWLVVPARTSTAESAVDELSVESARYVLRGLWKPRIVRATVLLLVGNWIWQAFTSFYPTYLVEVKGFSSPVAGSLFGLFFALGILVKPLSGEAYDRVGIRRALVVLMGISALAFGALPFVEGFWPLVVVTGIASFMLGFGAILLAYITVALPENMQGTGLGFIRTTYWIGGSTSPILFGTAADFGFFDEGFLALALLSGLMIALSLRLPEIGDAAASG